MARGEPSETPPRVASRAIAALAGYNKPEDDERQRRKSSDQAGERTMSATHVVVEGTLRADGSLQLDSKVNLPPGRVQLIVQPLPELPKDDPFWQMMQRIWAAREAAELVPRSTEEVEAQRKALRDELEEEIENAGRLQDESARLRQGATQMPRDNP
jgi:hypothetical protein